jgi:chemotaxis protein MotB
LTASQNELAKLRNDYDAAVAKRDQFQKDYEATKSNLDNLQSSYKALEENSSSSLAENAKKNRELLAQLEAKEQALAGENARLEKLKRDMDARSQRIAELENIILYIRKQP